MPAELAGARLLIVDDTPQNLRLISDFLAEQGFELMLTRSGAQALEKLQLATPDLVLLDVRMPGMDGFEVCRRLKADPSVADIPVIFMTALDDSAHKVEGFRLGAVDYVTKPIQRDELLARIRLHLQLHRLQRELTQKSDDLAAKNLELEAYAHTIAHSLKTPLATATRFLEILHKYKSAALDEETRQLVRQAFDAMANTGDVVDALLLLSTVEQQPVQLQPLEMSEVVASVQSQLAELRERSAARIEVPAQWPRALGYAPWIAEVWLNLLTNAIKYGGTPPRMRLGASVDGGQVRFWVRDNGEPLSAQAAALVFIPFTRLHRERAAGHGLGLATVQRIVTRLGGEVGVNPGVDGGNEFFFSLPALVAHTQPVA